MTASTTFDLPLPLGPTTTVMPGSNSSTVGSANDLNPFMLSDFRNTGATLVVPSGRAPPIPACPLRTALTDLPVQTWQCSQKKVERPPVLTRTITFRQRRQAWPSRS